MALETSFGRARIADADAAVVAGDTLGVAPVAAGHVAAAPSVISWRGSSALWRWVALATSDMIATAVVLLVVGNIAHKPSAVFIGLAMAPLAVLLGQVAGLYRRDARRLTNPGLDELPMLFGVAGLIALGAGLLAEHLSAWSYGVKWVTATWFGCCALLVVGRVLARHLVTAAHRPERLLVIGPAHDTDWIQERISSSGVRAEIVAVVPITARDIAELSPASGPGAIETLARDLAVDRVIVSPPRGGVGSFSDLIRFAKEAGVAVSLVTGLQDLLGSKAEREDCNGLRLVAVSRFGLSYGARMCKRAVDVAGATLALALGAPLLLLVALLVKLDSPGPVMFRQERVGRESSRFQMLKFRSMVEGADARKASLMHLHRNQSALFKLADDPRVTRIGKFLRRTSLDELPQLINVLRGEMSLVGPRPLIVEEDEMIFGLDRRRLYVRPGMTGPWQVLRSRVTRDRMVEVDYQYASNWSMWLDFKIMVLTVAHVLRRGNF